MKVRMKLLERIMLPGILPERASFEVGIAVNDIKQKVAVTQDEVKRVGLRTLPTGGMQWDAAKDRAIEFEFTNAELLIIRGALEKASKDGVLPTDAAIIKLYQDFVINEPKETKPKNKTK